MSRLAPFFAILLLCAVQADADLVDFETLADLDLVTTQFSGLTFSNTITLTAGFSLNEFDFPPRSGVNVVADSQGPITILFSTPVQSFSGYFTYVTPLSLQAFDSTAASVGLAQSLFSANYSSSPNNPNELLQVAFAGGISRVVITGDSSGGSFVMDDVSFSSVPEPPGRVPEPSGVFLLVTVSTFVLWSRRRSKHHNS